jgi:hypothetical protein
LHCFGEHTRDRGEQERIKPSLRTSSTGLRLRPQYPHYVWLYALRLSHLRSLLDLHESALWLSLGPTQLPLPPDLPDLDRTTLHLPDMPSRICRLRDYRNGPRPLGLQPAHSKSCRWQLCDSWSMGKCTTDFERLGR